MEPDDADELERHILELMQRLYETDSDAMGRLEALYHHFRCEVAVQTYCSQPSEPAHEYDNGVRTDTDEIQELLISRPPTDTKH